jgi:uncharacterized protein YbaR (Trm112 family)
VPLDPELVEILACPACESRPPLRLAGETLVCDQCGRIYAIEDDIPNLLPEEATLPTDGLAKETATGSGSE